MSQNANNEGAPVDVLAVMDADGRAVACVIDSCSPGTLRQEQWEAHLVKHDEARAAVAELIRVAGSVAVDLSAPGAPTKTERDDMIARLSAALAGIGGAA